MSKILVVDDHEIFRSGLVALLTTVYEDLEILEAADANEAENKFAAEKPELVVLDHELPGRSGLDLFRDLRAHHPRLKAIFLTGKHSGVLVRELISEGAIAVLGKTGPGDELLKVIDDEFSGKQYVSEVFSKDLEASSILDTLTKRERESLSYLVDGLTTQQIADAMGVSYKTAESHRTKVMAKLDVHNYQELVSKSQKMGLLS